MHFCRTIIVAMTCLLLPVLVAIPLLAGAQVLKPGFDKQEYIELLKIAQRQHVDVNSWDTIKTVPPPVIYHFAYRSPVMGLENIWDLWTNKSTAVISVRGTTNAPVSWLANLYAAMVPATGSLQLEKDFKFNYNLTPDPKAAVHTGWLVAAAYLSRDMLPKIDSCYKAGIKDFVLTGHSQGAGITFLLTSHLRSLQQQGKLPSDIRFKTYCSAAPKPGNLYYAYSYEHITSGGWGYTVVNASDWVPETPFSIQTVNDFNNTNAFKNAKALIRQQKFPANIALRHVYNKLSRPAIKAQRNYRRYLGKMVSKEVKKQLKEFETPEYFSSNNYSRAGSMIVLYPSADYYKIYPDLGPDVWTHHFIEPYLYLAERL